MGGGKVTHGLNKSYLFRNDIIYYENKQSREY